MGAPVGTLTLDEASDRDVLLVAGSTGLAPLKAILEQIAGRPVPPRVHLFFGARDRDGLYDLEHLSKLAAELPWLTVVPAVSDEPVPDESGGHGFSALLGSGGGHGTGREGPANEGIEHGDLPDVVARRGPWPGHDAYVCGPAAMAEAAVERLAASGVARDRIRLESFADAQR
jgi:NAD(P)H-flavin reductase